MWGSSSLCGFNKVRLEKYTVTGRSRGTTLGLREGAVERRSREGGLALNAEGTASENRQPAGVQGDCERAASGRAVPRLRYWDLRLRVRGRDLRREASAARRAEAPPSPAGLRAEPRGPRLQLEAGIGVAEGRRRTRRAARTPVEAVRL